jgi:hypothetical protein
MWPAIIEDSFRFPFACSFFALRYLLPMVFGVVTKSLPQKRLLSASEQRLVGQRLSRAVIGFLLVSVSANAIVHEGNFGNPWRGDLALGLLAMRCMLWYLMADCIDLAYSFVVYGTPSQWDLWVHHFVGFVELFVFYEYPTGWGFWF